MGFWIRLLKKIIAATVGACVLIAAPLPCAQAVAASFGTGATGVRIANFSSAGTAAMSQGISGAGVASIGRLNVSMSSLSAFQENIPPGALNALAARAAESALYSAALGGTALKAGQEEQASTQHGPGLALAGESPPEQTVAGSAGKAAQGVVTALAANPFIQQVSNPMGGANSSAFSAESQKFFHGTGIKAAEPLPPAGDGSLGSSGRSDVALDRPGEPVPPGEPDVAAPKAPREVTARGVVAIVLIAPLLTAGFEFMILKMGFVPPLTMAAALLAVLFFGVARMKNLTAQENNFIQAGITSATGVAFMSVVIAALDMLGFTLPPVTMALWLTVAFTLGTLMAIPVLRHFMGSPFPNAQAAIEFLPVLENPTGPGAKKAAALGITGIATVAFSVLRDVFHWIPAAIANKYKLGLEPSLMLIGTGMLMGIRTVLSLLVTAVLFWGIIAPILIANGLGADVAQAFNMQADLAQGNYYAVLMRGLTMWAATILMLTHGLASLLFDWRSFVSSFKSFAASAKEGPRGLSGKALLGGILALTAALALIQYLWLGVHWVVTLLGVLISVPLMFVGLKVKGETSIGPISILGSLTQMIFGVVTPGNMAVNMINSGTTASIAGSSEYLGENMKIAQGLGNKPRSMILAQLIGIPIGAVTAVAVYPLLKAAYGIGTTALPVVTSLKWMTLGQIFSLGGGLPTLAIWVMLAAGVAGIALGWVEKRWPKRAPSAIGIGMALLLPAQMVVPIALGGILAWLFSKYSPSKSSSYLTPAAAGFLVGEALMALVIPLLRLAGVL